MIEFEHYKKNLNTADKYDIKDVNVSKSTIYGAHVNKLKNYKSKEEKDANWQNRPLAVAVIGTNNTAAPLPNETEFWDPWTYIDNQELFLSFKPTCYIILGKPGAGSYVLGEALAQHLKCVHLNPKGILMDEIEQKSPTGICIHFNMGNDKVITFEMLFKLLKIKLESEIIKHRGYIISGFPLVTCSRNQQYLINSLYGEEGVSVVKDIMFDTIANLKKKKKKKPPGSPSISLSSASEILGEGGIEEEEEEEKEEELPEEEEELKVVLPEHLLDTCSDLIHPSLVYYNTKKGVLLQQLNDLFALNMKPDIIIYLSCPDKDLVKKNSCTFIDYKTHKETINLFDPKIPKTDLNRWPLKYSTNDYTSPYYSIDFKPKYNVRQPQKFEHKSVEQMCNYRQDILPFLKKKLEEFDPKFVLKVDARLSLYEMLHEITEKLAMIKIKPVYIPEPLYMEEPPDEPEEFWKIVEEQNVIRGGAAAFTKSASPWFNRCPVELKKRLSVKGNPKLAIAFLKHVYLTASLSNFISFYKNPRPFLKLKYLEPTCRIIVTGTKLSGKTMISECLSWLFDAPILNFTEIYQTEATKKYEAYAKTVLSEIIATIEDSRLTKWQNTEMERLNQIDQWCKSTITTLKKYIPLLKQYLAQSKENTEATGPPLDATFIRNFKKLRTSIAYLPFLDNIDECLYALTDGVVESYAPIELKMPKDKPTLPILGDDDVTEAITAYIAANDLQNEIIPNVEEIVSTLANQISSIDFEHQQRTNLTEMYGKYIIDGFPSEVEYWDSLTELNLLPDYTVSLIENREIEPELIHHYKTINNCLKNHQERYILAEDPFVKIKLKNESLPKVLDLDMKIILHEFVAGLSASDNIENTGVVEEIPLTEPWLSFSETIEKFKEGWDLTKIKLEENYKCIIEVQLENKTDIEIVEEILLKLRKGYYIMCEVNEDEDLEEDVEGQEAPKDMMTYNSSQNFGETSLYCPIAYYRHGVLWEGKPEFSVKFDSKLYRICNEANLQIFQDDVTKYQNYDKPSKTFPPVRICVIGCIGSGKTTVSKLLAKELGLMHIDFAEVVNDMLMPRHFKKVGRQYENSFADVPIDDEAVVEFQIDESNENLISDIMSNEMELRRMVYNYFERGSQIIPQIMQKLITKLWFEDPFVNTGFVLDGYPKLPTDIEDMVSCYCIPDIIIELECTSESALARLAPSMFKTWRVQLTEAREKSKNKLAKEKQEWIEFLTKNIVAKLIIDEILDSNFFVSEPIKEPSNESVLINANPSGSEINFNLFSTYNEMIQAFPEPVDQNEWEKADDARERIDSRLEGRYESDDENIQALKDILPDHRIKIVSIDGNKSLTKVTRLALSKVASLRNRNESFFEETFILSPDITELLISKGIFFLSNKFNRMCPVYIYENPNAILNIYGLSKQKNEVFPVAHRSYIYFIFGKESLRKFRSNPLKYIMGKNICNYKEYPLRISVIGAPKSGKSTLAAKLAKRFGLICFSRGIALRSILNNKYWTELGTKMLTALTAGDCVSMEQIVKAVQTMAIDHRTTTNGFVFDGFPETASEAMELDKVGLYPTIVFDITSDLEYISESSQKEIYYDLLKINPTHSRPFIENRFMKWKERTYNLRDWIQDDYQNLYPIDGNKSKWECIQQAVNIIKDFVPKVHNYLTKVNSDVVPVDFMCISNENFEKRISCYKHNCPLCLRENVLRHNKNPCNKKGIVQFRNQFYWICQKHTDEVMKNPHCYLKTKKIDLPELPVIVKKINLSLVYENGICIVTYAEHLPSQMLVMGKCDYACSYRGNRYMLCSQTCLDKFLEKPHLYSDITVFRRVTIDKPITLKDLPHIGYLEQTVAIIITEACISVTVHRPKYPGLSFQLSAILHIALYLKTHNPLINKKVLEVYQKTSKVYNARCKLIPYLGMYLRSMDNPFAKYPKCCGIVETESTSRVPVPDERYDFLVEYHKPASKVPAFLNVVDIAGLVRGAAEGQGLGNAFLSHIKACDAIFNLCRAFDDEDVIHVDGDVNPIRDLETIGEELRLKDEEQLMANFEKLDRVVSRGGDKKLKPEYDALTRIKAVLVDEKKHIRFGDWSAADIEILNKYLFLTSKPALYLVNLSEKDYIRKKNKWLPKLKEWIDKNDPGAALIPFSGVLENKLMEMDAEERKAYLKEHNITSALEKIIVQGYKALNLEYFFTAGADEVKAWTIQKGTKAPQAAGRIHTDFEKGFIMAEVMHFKDFKEEGSEAACKSAGKYRQQGRNYVVEDGDIIFFKFNAGAGLKDAKKK